MKKLFLCLSVILFAAALSSAELCWKGKGLAQWQAKRNVKCRFVNNVLKLTFDKDDPQIASPLLRLDPARGNCFSITYRARGLKGKSGEMYFAHAPGDFAFRKYWIVPAFRSDWRWHTVTVSSRALFNAPDWFEGGIIYQLRFDPVNSAGGEMEISEIKFFKK